MVRNLVWLKNLESAMLFDHQPHFSCDPGMNPSGKSLGRTFHSLMDDMAEGYGGSKSRDELT